MDLVRQSGMFAKPKQNRHRKSTRLQQEARMGWLFLSPWVIGFIMLKALPILASLVFSFTDFYMLEPGATQFVGFENYARFWRDAEAGASLSGSLGYFLLTVPIEIFVAMILAAVMTSPRIRNKRLLKTLIFMTSVIPATSIFFIYQGSLQYAERLFLTEDVFNASRFGPFILPPLSFTVFTALWSIGPGFLILLGAMESVPNEIHEAARVDGAGPFARFLLITLPMISPAVFFTLVINLTAAFGGSVLLDRGYILSFSLSPMESYINNVMFRESDLGYASALAWITFAIMMTITVVLFRSSRNWVYFPEEDADAEI